MLKEDAITSSADTAAENVLNRELLGTLSAVARKKGILEGLEAAYDSPSVQADSFRNMANGLLHETTLLDEDVRPGLFPLTDDIQKHLILESSPTIASFGHYSFSGSVLAAVAAQRMRETGGTAPNILFVPLCSGAAHFRRFGEEWHLYVTKAALVDAQGNIFFGSCEALPVDCIVDCRMGPSSWRRNCEEKGLLVYGSSEVHERYLDKTESHALGRAVGTSARKWTLLSGQESSVRAAVDTFLDAIAAREVVVKPVNQSLGRGVKIFPVADAADIAGHAQRILATHTAALIEERVECFPLYGRRGTPLDWNIRALITREGPLDYEVRLAPTGGPVNKAQGAEIVEFEPQLYLRSKLENDEAIALYWKDRKRVDELCAKIGKTLGKGFFGADLILDAQHNVHLIEISAGTVGGLTSLAKIRESVGGKLYGPSVFVSDLLHELPSAPKRPEGDGDEQVPLTLDPAVDTPALTLDLCEARSAAVEDLELVKAYLEFCGSRERPVLSYSLAAAYMSRQLWDEALGVLRSLPEVIRNDVYAERMEISLIHATTPPWEAHRHIQRFLEQRGLREETLSSAIRLKLEDGPLYAKDARRDMRRFETLFPESPEKWMQRARLSMMFGDVWGGYRNACRYLRHDPGDVTALYLRASAQYLVREFESAVRGLEQALARYQPRDEDEDNCHDAALLELQLAQMRAAQGDTKGARKLFEDIGVRAPEVAQFERYTSLVERVDEIERHNRRFRPVPVGTFVASVIGPFASYADSVLCRVPFYRKTRNAMSEVGSFVMELEFHDLRGNEGEEGAE